MLQSVSILYQRQQKYVILCVPVPIILAQKDTELKLNTLIQNPICEDDSSKWRTLHVTCNKSCPFFSPS